VEGILAMSCQVGKGKLRFANLFLLISRISLSGALGNSYFGNSTSLKTPWLV